MGKKVSQQKMTQQKLDEVSKRVGQMVQAGNNCAYCLVPDIEKNLEDGHCKLCGRFASFAVKFAQNPDLAQKRINLGDLKICLNHKQRGLKICMNPEIPVLFAPCTVFKQKIECPSFSSTLYSNYKFTQIPKDLQRKCSCFEKVPIIQAQGEGPCYICGDLTKKYVETKKNSAMQIEKIYLCERHELPYFCRSSSVGSFPAPCIFANEDYCLFFQDPEE